MLIKKYALINQTLRYIRRWRRDGKQSHLLDGAYCIAGKFGGEFNFGGLAVYITTANLKSAKISYSHIHV